MQKDSRDSRMKSNFRIDILLSAPRFQQFGIGALSPLIQLFHGGIVGQTSMMSAVISRFVLSLGANDPIGLSIL